MKSNEDLLQRLLQAYTGGGDPAIRDELRQDDSEARILAEDIRRLARKRIDVRQIAGMEWLADSEEAGAAAILSPPAPCQEVDSLPRILDRRRRWRIPLAAPRRLRWVAAVLLIAATGFGWAGWRLAFPPPLMEDHFRGRRLDSRIWRCERERVKQEDGYVRLTNRGYLVTKEHYPGPIEISFRWKFLDLGEQPLYWEHLTVALRTSGLPQPQYPHEVLDGIAVKLNAVSGAVQVTLPPEKEVQFSAAREKARFLADTWYDVRITDDGETVAIYCEGPGMPEDASRNPLLLAHCPAASPQHHIALYNRELVAGIPHESHLNYFAVKSLREK